MGKPKVPNGVRLSVMLPAEDLKRLKIQCIERGMLESAIVLEALREYWQTPRLPKLPPFEELPASSQAAVKILRELGQDPYPKGSPGLS